MWSMHDYVGCTTIIFGIITGIIGLILIGIAGSLKYLQNNYFTDYFNGLKENAEESIALIPVFFPESYRNIKIPEIPEEDFGILINEIFIELIVFGVLLLIMSIFGACINKNTKCYYILPYTVILIAITLTMIGAYLYGCQMFIDRMKYSLEGYSGLADDSISGLTWTAIMLGGQCCGVEGYKDFEDLDDWPPNDLKDYTFNVLGLIDDFDIPQESITPEFQYKFITEKGCQTFVDRSTIKCDWMNPENFKTPMACCKSLEDLGRQCYTKANATEKNNWLSHGCIEHVNKHLAPHKSVLMFTSLGVIISMALFSLLMVIRLIVGAVDDKKLTQPEESEMQEMHSEENPDMMKTEKSEDVSQMTSHTINDEYDNSSPKKSLEASRVSSVNEELTFFQRVINFITAPFS